MQIISCVTLIWQKSWFEKYRIFLFFVFYYWLGFDASFSMSFLLVWIKRPWSCLLGWCSRPQIVAGYFFLITSSSWWWQWWSTLSGLFTDWPFLMSHCWCKLVWKLDHFKYIFFLLHNMFYHSSCFAVVKYLWNMLPVRLFETMTTSYICFVIKIIRCIKSSTCILNSTVKQKEQSIQMYPFGPAVLH